MDISLRDTAKLLLESDNIVITGHIHPDGDCLGSMLALYLALREKGKNVQMLLDDDIPNMYRFLPGSEDIRRPAAPVNANLLVVLDASDADRILGVQAVVDAKVLNIDHHISNTKFADYWYIESAAAATGEIILELLHNLQAKISREMAICLYTAIATDCGFFKYANTTAKTLRNAAVLVDYGVEPHIISEQLDTKPMESIIALKKVLETLEFYANGRIATITVVPDLNEEAAESTEGLINYPRNVEGVELAIMFKYADSQSTRVSFRSRNVDVSKLALSFGGGGHARAAGCSVTGELASAKRKVLDAANKLLQESSV